ncbi:gamma-glutamyltransferase family protein [Streptomyces sp. 7N604]|uniref:gamma-glutamyltransferase family protein n=1 Tax=Streptomyces sp. 7N604 TaxID=3457415 RepID=UPI003FD25B41
MTARQEIWGSVGVASATHWLAANAGTAMYQQGGNAADAAVAGAFVLNVVEPHLNGLGGDVTILVHDPSEQKTWSVCGQGPMPQRASIARMRALGLDHVPASGLLAATVPGAFGAWITLLREFGSLPLRTVLEPAIYYAESGHPLLPGAARMIEAVAPVFRDHWTESGRTHLTRGGQAPRAGQRVMNPDLGDTFRRLLAEAEGASTRSAQLQRAAAAFYSGFVASAIDAACQRPTLDCTGEHHVGFLTADDLARWSPTIEATESLVYRDHLVHKASTWSQGPVFLQQLALLGHRRLSELEFLGPDYLHYLVEAAKLAFADREAWYADPAFVNVPLPDLLAADYNRSRSRLLDGPASVEQRPGRPAGLNPRLPQIPIRTLEPTEPPWLVQLAEGVPVAVQATATGGDTCCITTADADGMLVAATPSGGWLKSSPVIPGLGFSLGTRGQMAWLDEAHPNALSPGKRPRTTLSPTIVERDGHGYLALGTPGGDQQDQWTLQVFLAHLDFGRPLQQAVEVPKLHTEHVPTSFAPRRVDPGLVVVEDSLPEKTRAILVAAGHRIRTVPAQSLGKVCASVIPARGEVLAAASPNGQQAHATGG